MIGRLYIITNNVNNKVYIGKTYNTLKVRFDRHIEAMSDSNSKNRPLYKDMRKYGYTNYKIELLGIFKQGELEDKENEYIMKYRDKGIPLYNISNGYDGSMLCDEYLEDLILNLYLYDKKSTKDISKICKCSVSLVNKILKNNYIFPDNISKYRNVNKCVRKVLMLDKVTEKIIKKFNSIVSAGKYVGTDDASHISKVCRGKRNIAYGYKWKYA